MPPVRTKRRRQLTPLGSTHGKSQAEGQAEARSVDSMIQRDVPQLLGDARTMLEPDGGDNARGPPSRIAKRRAARENAKQAVENRMGMYINMAKTFGVAWLKNNWPTVVLAILNPLLSIASCLHGRSLLALVVVTGVSTAQQMWKAMRVRNKHNKAYLNLETSNDLFIFLTLERILARQGAPTELAMFLMFVTAEATTVCAPLYFALTCLDYVVDNPALSQVPVLGTLSNPGALGTGLVCGKLLMLFSNKGIFRYPLQTNSTKTTITGAVTFITVCIAPTLVFDGMKQIVDTPACTPTWAVAFVLGMFSQQSAPLNLAARWKHCFERAKTPPALDMDPLLWPVTIALVVCAYDLAMSAAMFDTLIGAVLILTVGIGVFVFDTVILNESFKSLWSIAT